MASAQTKTNNKNSNSDNLSTNRAMETRTKKQSAIEQASARHSPSLRTLDNTKSATRSPLFESPFKTMQSIDKNFEKLSCELKENLRETIVSEVGIIKEKMLTDLKGEFLHFKDEILKEINASLEGLRKEIAAVTQRVTTVEQQLPTIMEEIADLNTVVSSLTPNTSALSSVLLNDNSTHRPKQQLPMSPGDSRESKQQRMDQLPLSLADLMPKPKLIQEKAPVMVNTNTVKSIYITPFATNAQPDDIMNHLKSNDDLNHIVPDIKCTRLTKKGQRLTFVSFKLEVPRHHYDIIADPAIWRVNGEDKLTIEEFIQKENPFFKPKVTRNREQNQQSSNGENTANRQRNKPKITQIQQNNFRSTNDNGANNAKRLQNNCGNRSYTVQQSYNQRQNFHHSCQRQCCSHPRPQSICGHDHYGENQFSHRLINRHRR